MQLCTCCIEMLTCQFFRRLLVHQLQRKCGPFLEKVFMGVDRVKQMRLQILRGELEAMRMKYSEDVHSYITYVMKDGLFNLPVDEESDVVASEEDMHDPTLNSMLNNLRLKDDESVSVTTKVELVKDATSMSTHTVDLSAPICLQHSCCSIRKQGRDPKRTFI